jgi:DNA-binding MarR family transcriptional regulator
MAKKIVREQNAAAAEPEEEEGQDWRITTNRMTRPSSSLKVEVSIEDFASMNQGLIRLLQAIDNSPGGSISTVKLLTKLKSTGYGQHIIRRAVREGYMARKEQPPEGRGNYLVINYLTPKGKALLRKLSEVN